MPREIEASVQMRLYTLNKRQLTLVFIIFFLSFGGSVLLALLGPEVIYSDSQSQSWNPKQIPVSVSVTNRLPLSSFNQQLWLLATIKPLKGSDPLNGDVDVVVHIYRIIDGSEVNLGQAYNHTRHISCHGDTCSQLVIMHLGYIDNEMYKVTVVFLDLEKIGFFSGIDLEFRCYKSPFTEMELWFRFAFLALTVIISILFSRSLRYYTWRDWSIEQKWMIFLLPFLLLYNNPLFALSFLLTSSLPMVLDGIFQATFLSSLLLFWLSVFHSIREPRRRFLTFYLPKLIVVGLIWLAAVTLSTWQAVVERTDPTFNFVIDLVNFMGFKVFLYVIAGIYTCYFIYLLVRAFTELRNVANFGMRVKFNTVLISFVFAVSLAILILRFGKGLLDENLLANTEIHQRYTSAAEFISFYALLNFYIYTVAYVFSPSKNALIESRLHDNPVISMLNDSEEDCMYGSDKETSRARFAGKFDADSD